MADSIKEAALNALQSKRGEHSAMLEGASADLIRRSMPEGAIPSVHIKVIKRFKQEGCGRLRITYLVSLQSHNRGKPVPVSGIELNLCPDGSAPEEGKDEEAGKKFQQMIDQHRPK